MKRTITALSIGVLGVLGAGDSFAYLTFLGADPNGSSTNLPASILSSLDAQERFFGASTPQVEDFENQAPGSGSRTLAFGTGDTAVNATLTSVNGAVVSATTPQDGRFSVPGGSRFWAATATSGGDTFAISFDANVEAFGFFGIDIGDFGGNLSLELLNAAGNVIGTPFSVGGSLVSTDRDGSVLYFGIRAQNDDEWFRGIRFRLANTTAAEDAFAFDSFTVVGAPQSVLPPPSGVPEPGSLALAALALLGLGMTRRRA